MIILIIYYIKNNIYIIYTNKFIKNIILYIYVESEISLGPFKSSIL